MRLDRLRIKEFKNLRDFQIDFDEHRDVAVLVGRNGSAKSNLMEAIIRIFRFLQGKDKKYPFDFEIAYLLDMAGNLGTQRIEFRISEGQNPELRIDGETKPFSHFTRNRLAMLPRGIIAYYSGESPRMRELFFDYEREYEKAARSGEDEGFRPLMVAHPIHAQLALLSFMLSGTADDRLKGFLRDVLKIEEIDSVLFRIRRPDWARTRKQEHTDYYGAKGIARDVLERLAQNALFPMVLQEPNAAHFADTSKGEYYYLYLPDTDALRSAFPNANDPSKTFRELETLYLAYMLSEVRVRVKVRGADRSIGVRDLSEGEQQLITVLGLMRFLRDEEALYLLDEPDTHLNPTWGLSYLHYLRAIGQIDRKSHTLIATHDPVLVAGLRKEEVHILYRQGDGRICTMQPEEDPRGKGIASVLMSPLFGLESQLDTFSMKVVDRIYEVAETEVSPRRRRHLRRLRRLIPDVVPVELDSDPYRNIARRVYRRAQDRVMETDVPADRRQELVEKIATELVTEAERS